ncbi:TIGR03086 family protein [Trebonia kvetii]|uniref:TIGR03086 family protein n=1 Tax=Trebonia kvetii TaxID=2480626 RepID=A0A6P2C5U6_9ACTN|nr:TIGR03086 family metal-binding protein [Trebonia kvetii]TVZ06774.1 TIGR03086 family protein [Trebonia kvetii]
MDLFDALERAVTSTAEIVKETPAELLDAPTLCTEWDVRALLNHVIGTLWLAEGLFADRMPRHPTPPGGLPPVDLAGQDPAAAYAEAAAAALAAAAAGDALTRAHATPLGDMPGPVLAGATTLDILVHGWDLAVATGQPADLDGRLAAHVLGFAEQGLATPEARAGRIDPPLAVAVDAPVTQRLTAYLGRKA